MTRPVPDISPAGMSVPPVEHDLSRVLPVAICEAVIEAFTRLLWRVML